MAVSLWKVLILSLSPVNRLKFQTLRGNIELYIKKGNGWKYVTLALQLMGHHQMKNIVFYEKGKNRNFKCRILFVF
jgi:hypothetical protein